MDNMPDHWNAVLDEGPQALSAYLWRFLSGDIVDDSEPSLSPEYVADLYATLMSEAQRSCMRDAVTLALIANQDGAPDSADVYMALTSLASNIQLLSVRSTRTEDRLWTSVKQAQGPSPQVSSILSLLGSDGSIRPVDEWNEIYLQFGSESAIACVEGVRRHGVLEVLHWMNDTPDSSVRDGLMPAWLPMLVEDDMPAVAALLRNPRDDRDMRLRSMLTKWLSRYHISLPAKLRESATNSPAHHPAIVTTSPTVGFADYGALDQEGRSPAEAAALWGPVEDAAPWPKGLYLEGHADA